MHTSSDDNHYPSKEIYTLKIMVIRCTKNSVHQFWLLTMQKLGTFVKETSWNWSMRFKQNSDWITSSCFPFFFPVPKMISDQPCLKHNLSWFTARIPCNFSRSQFSVASTRPGNLGWTLKFDMQESLCPLVNNLVRYEQAPTKHLHLSYPLCWPLKCSNQSVKRHDKSQSLSLDVTR